LIELMISVTLIAVFFVGGAIYYNNFITKQKLNKAKAEVESMVRLAANYARTKQAPSGTDEVRYVRLQKSASNNIEADINGTPATYFSNKILEDGLEITFNPPLLYFWGGSGQLRDVNGNFYGSSQTATITIFMNQGIEETRTIIIDSLGILNERTRFN